MRHIRVASEALRLAADSSRQPYVCRSCKAQAARQLHTTSRRDAELPLYRRIKESMFGKSNKKKTPTEDSKDGEGEKKTPTEDFKDGEGEKKLDDAAAKQADDDYLAKIPRTQGGKTYDVAARYDPATTEGYLPATTWDGLEHVGSNIWAKKREDQGEKYQGFMSRKGSDLTHPAVQYKLAQHVLDVIHREMPETTKSKDLARIRINNSELKLTIVREISRFTGNRVPDLAISKARTAYDLLKALQTKEPPKKLKDDPRVQELEDSEELPNVKVYSRKRSPVDKEIDIGRWKVIVDELKLRNLPVFGTNHTNAKEGVRLHEKKVDWRKHGYFRHTEAKK